MPKERSKRHDVRKERKRKRKHVDVDPEDESVQVDQQPDSGLGSLHNDKRQRRNEPETEAKAPQPPPDFEQEYFGFIEEEERPVFHSLDEKLKALIDGTADPEAILDTDMTIEMAFETAVDKELKLACSQSFSRFFERLILLSNTAQKKKLFQAFAGHFMTLIRHRFASHICETLFILSHSIIAEELASFDYDKGEPSMEELFLATLDELEAYLTSIITDPYASHVLRALLLILSGRTMTNLRTKAIFQNQGKINPSGNDKAEQVPQSFRMAARKIISDTTASLDSTSLLVMALHPVGMPTLQIMLEIDMDMAKDSKLDPTGLAARIVPDVSAWDEEAEKLFTTLMFDRGASRLMEVLLSKCPGKTFKHLVSKALMPKMDAFVKGEFSIYPIKKVLERFSKDDLKVSVKMIIPTIPFLLERSRFMALSTLLERCEVRECYLPAMNVVSSIAKACGRNEMIVPVILRLGDRGVTEGPPRTAFLPHATNLLHRMLDVHGNSRSIVKLSIAQLSAENLLRVANESAATASLLVKIFQLPVITTKKQKYDWFHHNLINELIPHVKTLALEDHGHNVLNAIAKMPFNSAMPKCLDQKVKIAEALVSEREALMASKNGRWVWRTWAIEQFCEAKQEWKAMVVSPNGPAAQGVVSNDGMPQGSAEPKTQNKRPIDRAFERHLAATGDAQEGTPVGEEQAQVQPRGLLSQEEQFKGMKKEERRVLREGKAKMKLEKPREANGEKEEMRKLTKKQKEREENMTEEEKKEQAMKSEEKLKRREERWKKLALDASELLTKEEMRKIDKETKGETETQKRKKLRALVKLRQGLNKGENGGIKIKEE